MSCNKNNKKINNKKYKKIVLLFIIILLFVVNMTCIYLATSIIIPSTTVTETTKKPKGHKVYNAEYFEYDPNSDKYRIIIAEGEGGSGEGGGMSGAGTDNTTGKGSINGNANSSGSGGMSGVGSNTNAGSNGRGNGNTISNAGKQSSNITADFIRKSIEESKRESIERELETASNRQAVESSISERESLYESIERRIKQESINARINSDRYNINIVPSSTASMEIVNTEEYPTMITTHYDRPFSTEEIMPTENTLYETIPEADLKIYDMPFLETIVETVKESIGPGADIVELSDGETNVVEETSKTVREQEEEVTEGGGNKKEEVEIAEGNDDEFGSGALGKEDMEDSTGKLQDGDLDGFGYSVADGSFKNVKILALDRNGGLGLANIGRGKTIINKIIMWAIFVLMLIGTLKYTLPYFIKTKNKKSYF